MDIAIVNATGGGKFGAKVDEDNRLFTLSVAQGQTAAISLNKQQVYAWETGVIAVVGGVLTSILWLRNDDPSGILLIKRIGMSWNGGNTNRNRTVNAVMYVGSTEPVANHVAFVGGNLFLGSSNQSTLVKAYRWDTVGAGGMTHVTPGSPGARTLTSIGLWLIDYDGALIVPFGQAVSFSGMAEEDGKISLQITGWMQSV